MAFLTTDDGVRLFYRIEGPRDAPAVVFSNSLGTDHMMWQPQADALGSRFRIVRYDQRGHGASDAPQGAYTVERLGRDALAVADAAGLATFSFCGLSMGGITGQWLGIHAADRLGKLILAATAARFPDPRMWDERIAVVREKGLAGLVDVSMTRFFTEPYRQAAATVIEGFRRTFLATSPDGYIGCGLALAAFDFRGDLPRIATPTLVVAGREDPSTPLPMNEAIAAAIPGARLVVLDGAHIVSREQADAFNAALADFLGADGLPSDQRFARGLARRRQVLGDAWVDAALARRDEVNADFQDLITRYAWGEIWTRPGLDEETRRLLVLAITAAMGRWEEFELHARAALAGGVPVGRIREVLLQTAIYAGVPAANTAFSKLSALLKAQSKGSPV